MGMMSGDLGGQAFTPSTEVSKLTQLGTGFYSAFRNNVIYTALYYYCIFTEYMLILNTTGMSHVQIGHYLVKEV